MGEKQSIDLVVFCVFIFAMWIIPAVGRAIYSHKNKYFRAERQDDENNSD